MTCGIRQDYEGFFHKEIALRQELFYPPYSRLVKLLYQNASEAKAKAEAEALVKSFELAFAGREGHQVIRPAPAVIAQADVPSDVFWSFARFDDAVVMSTQ